MASIGIEKKESLNILIAVPKDLAYLLLKKLPIQLWDLVEQYVSGPALFLIKKEPKTSPVLISTLKNQKNISSLSAGLGEQERERGGEKQVQ